MDYRYLLKEENEGVKERYELSMERIRAMKEEKMEEPWDSYFKRTGEFVEMMDDLVRQLLEDCDLSLEQMEERNQRLYGDILPENYDRSYANPSYGAEMLGKEMGQLLCFLYTEIRGEIALAFEMRLEEMTAINETFIEVYNLFQEAMTEGRKSPEPKTIQDALYWYVSDYADLTVRFRIREGVDPKLSFAADLIRESDLEDLRYLYRFGEYISPGDRELASFMNKLPQETVNRMADTYTEGFRRGFQVMGRDLSKKKTVVIEYQLGFERMIRRAMENFEAMGLQPVFYRAAVQAINRRAAGKRGYYGSSPNRQYDYDHRYDSALFMGSNLKERKLAVTRAAYEEFRDLAAVCAGPAVVETFGLPAFHPVNSEAAFALSAYQQEVSNEMANEIRRITNQYMPGDETSFTIIAFPRPEIGKDFEGIFRDTIALNTLDYEKYQKIQQAMIDVLDRADQVHITGRGNNKTDLWVKLHALHDREKETNFENCVADVNIPLGEVFTSPVLEGTEGLLYVDSVYIEEYQFRELWLRFEKGWVTDYGCGNFKPQQNWKEQGRELVKQVILRGHEQLPMGEFAIGTNTTAYAMAKKYRIGDQLPILIAEKTGPHFAVGDTCYSFSEDSPMYNPDGKEVIARDNEVSILRKTDPARAYFSCHTDITVPYSELGDIVAVGEDEKEWMLIRQGRFVLEGTEELNRPLDGK